MKQEYYNQEAYNYIQSQLNKTKVNPLFKPIVTDIILRRKYEYQLEDKYFQRDVESFINNVKNIYVGDLPENVSGRFYLGKKSIVINLDEFKNNMNDVHYYEYLLETLAHECNHAMNGKKNGKDRTFEADNPLIDNTGILEIFTEKEADRIIYNREPDQAFRYRNQTDAYSFTTPYINAIAATFGIKEKELLGAAIKGKKELDELLNTNIKDRKFTENIFNRISLNINLAHIEFYKKNSEEINFENIFNSLKFIYRDMEQTLDYRIENLEGNNLEEWQMNLENIKLEQNAISERLEGPIVKEKDRETVRELAMYHKTMVYAKIMSIDEIIKSKNNNFPELISFVKQAKSVEQILQFMDQNGISVNSVDIALMPEFELSNQKKEEWIKEYCLDGEEWDNSAIIDYMIKNKEEMINAKEKPKLIDKIKGLIDKAKVYIDRFEDFMKKDSDRGPLLLEERYKRKK